MTRSPEELALMAKVQKAHDEWLEYRRAHLNGRCGKSMTGLLPGASVVICALPAKHEGWHRSDEGTEWNDVMSENAEAFRVEGQTPLAFAGHGQHRAHEKCPLPYYVKRIPRAFRKGALYVCPECGQGWVLRFTRDRGLSHGPLSQMSEPRWSWWSWPLPAPGAWWDA